MRRAGPGLTELRIYEGKLLLSCTPYRPRWTGQTNRYGFRYNMYSNGSWNVSGPLWTMGALLAFAATSVAAAPWLTWRFSLRTLLAAATITAVALGFIVWAARV